MRLIDADKINLWHASLDWNTEPDLCDIENYIDNCPTIDAEPIKHGYWIKLGESDFKCSKCGFRFTSGDDISMFPYCRCGAKMNEKVIDNE